MVAIVDELDAACVPARNRMKWLLLFTVVWWGRRMTVGKYWCGTELLVSTVIASWSEWNIRGRCGENSARKLQNVVAGVQRRGESILE